MMGRFDGQGVIVTGGSSGIGRACVLAFVREGASVLAVGRDAERLEETRSLASDSSRVELLIADVGVSEQARGLVEVGIRHFERVHVLVNNAGIAFEDDVLALPEDHWRQTMAVNLDGAFFASQEAARHMVANGGGAIVNLCSTDSLQVESPQTHYNASKAALWMVTRSMAHELGHLGVRVNAVAPGETDTAMTTEELQDESFRKAYLKQVPMRRVGQPEDVADAVVFLASAEASYITGVILPVDGGQLTGTWYDPRNSPTAR